MTLAQAVLEFNRPYENRARAALIHRIEPAVADEVAGYIATNARVLMPVMSLSTLEAMAYFAAVIGQESRFDPHAINMNLSLADAPLALLRPAWDTFQFHRRANSPLLLKGDYGVAMFKLKYLAVATDARDCTQHRTPAEVIDACSFTPGWALRLSAQRYAGLLRWSQFHFPNEDPRWMATGAYNQGQRGFTEAYHDHTKPAWAAAQRHIARVHSHYQWFTANLTEA